MQEKVVHDLPISIYSVQSRTSKLKCMAVIVSVSKTELKKHKELSRQLTQLSVEIIKLEEACMYMPAPGHLMAFIKLLDQYSITYHIHSSTAQLSE